MKQILKIKLEIVDLPIRHSVMDLFEAIRLQMPREYTMKDVRVKVRFIDAEVVRYKGL